MISLPNGCWCTGYLDKGTNPQLPVHPKNWKTARASIRKNWYIKYRFYDPTVGNPKQVVIKGMNVFKELPDRQALTQQLLSQELDLLLNKGYNPITGQFNTAEEIHYEIDPSTPFIKALASGKKKIQSAESTERDLRTMLPHVEAAAKQLRFENIPVGQIKRRHIRLLLDRMEDNAKFKSAHRYNKHRTNFMMIFSELTELDAIEFNPVRDIRKRKTTHKLREVLETQERQRINKCLLEVSPALHTFAHIFFHSGSRMTEIRNVKPADVDLNKQRFKVLIKKGKEYREAWKTIKDVAMPYWERALKECEPDDYVFGKHLLPGPVPVNRDWITKKWQDIVKVGLGINKDFYSLKHLNTDETAALIGIEDAAAHDDHSTPVITLKHYAVGEKSRKHERLKKVGNKFAE
jgi:integrase